MSEDEITRVRNQLRHYQGNYRDACKLSEEILIQFGEYRESAEAKIKELEARALKAEAILAQLEKWSAPQGELPGGRADLALATVRSWLDIARATVEKGEKG